MFKFLSVKEQLVHERKRNERLQSESLKNTSDIDYIAMMADIELESGTEESNDEQI